MQLPARRLASWTCPDCGRPLRNVTLPVNCSCRAQARSSGIDPDEFVSVECLVADTLSLAPELPAPGRIVGIARSGLIPASVLSTTLGGELWSIDQHSLELQSLGTGTRMRGTPVDGPTVLVDDSTWSGNAMSRCRQAVERAFGSPPICLAIYGPPHARLAGVRIRRRMRNHWFAWNLPNAPFVGDIGFDLDGVLCRDFTAAEDDDGPQYVEAMRAMQPSWVRPRKPISIVTARLERYRAETESWLAWQRIPIRRLLMGPWASKAEREASDVWRWKADQCAELGVSLFVESSSIGAARIRDLAGIHTISLDDGRLHVPQLQQLPDGSDCRHRGESIGSVVCRSCGGERAVEVYRCDVHGRCHLEFVEDDSGAAGERCRWCARRDKGYQTRGT